MSDNSDKIRDEQKEEQSHVHLKKTILVVEDDWNSQKYYEHLLSSQYDIFTSATSGGAFSMIQDYVFDLIIMDIMIIGEEDGLSLTRRIRSIDKYRSLPVIAVSAYAFPEDKIKALKAGCNDFLSKPVKKDDLLGVIHKYLK